MFGSVDKNNMYQPDPASLRRMIGPLRADPQKRWIFAGLNRNSDTN